MSQQPRFVEESVQYLRDVYVPRLERAVSILPETSLWWRPHPDAIAVGTILLHLEGNVRQWILSGLGGAEDRRERATEFAAKDGPSGPELLEALRRTVHEACDVIAGFTPEMLSAAYTIQGRPTSGLGAIYHVVEHFAWHTGQAVWIAKARAGQGHGLAFYDEAEVNAARNER